MKTIRYAVKIGDLWLGTKRYSYKYGTHSALSEAAHARLFTRKRDADKAASCEGGTPVPVEVTFPN